ncbi:MAG TPA: GAF domain-containing protein [Solirubrobacteraceae bacterium]|nr:GAF domain-containing protein [Solirubrobacteraceae bacterium]
MSESGSVTATGPDRAQEPDGVAAGVLDVAHGILEDLDVDIVLDRVLAAARDLTGARYAALGVLDAERTHLERFLTLGMDEETRRRVGQLPAGRGILGELIRDPAPLRIAELGSHPRSYGFPHGHPPMSSFLGVPLLVRGQPYGNLYLTDKRNGGEFTEQDEETVVLLSQFAGVAVDHARRYTEAERQRAELQRTVSALDATIQIARAVGGQTDLNAILGLVAKRGRALVAARALVIELTDGDELVVAAGAGELPGGLIGRRVPLAGTVAGAAARSRQTQHLTDELNRARYEQHGLGQLGLSARTGLVVPLVFRAQTLGVLVAIDQLEDGPFTAEHQRLLEAFAASAATAVATAQSAQEDRRRQRQAAAEAERTRWARELHDETLQNLANVKLILAAGQRAAAPEAMAAALRDGIGQLEADIASLRALITELRPAALDQLGVDAAVRALAERMGRSGLTVDTSITLGSEEDNAQPRLAPDLETGIYRTVQEALTNARKHGQAQRAVVEITEQGRHVTVSVRDDGVGFDPAVKTEGFGLLGMHERVELLDGTLTISSARGTGTTVVAVMPVRHRAAAPDARVSSG